jgi:hypothetical protein
MTKSEVILGPARVGCGLATRSQSHTGSFTVAGN